MRLRCGLLLLLPKLARSSNIDNHYSTTITTTALDEHFSSTVATVASGLYT